jgi:protein arginine kinase activator
MLCQNCNQEQATLHYKQVINGESTQLHLCAKCAEETGNSHLFSAEKVDFGFGLDSLLSHMLGGRPLQKRKVEVCPLCGSSAEDISRSGRVGCAMCYTQFSDMLIPYIRRIHGNTSHAGRIPENAGSEIKKKKQIEQLQNEMNIAVQKQEFERAAELRDEIKELANES